MMITFQLVSEKRHRLFNNQYNSLLDSSNSPCQCLDSKLAISYNNNMEYKVVNAMMLTYSYYFLV